MNGFFSTLVFTYAVLVAIGIGLGLTLGYFLFPSMRQAKRLREELESLRREHDIYKAGVSEHFQKTADLVGEMTKSYAAVYDHLAGGARRFCGDEIGEKALPLGSQLTIVARSDGGPSVADDAVVIETREAAQEVTPPASVQTEFPAPAQEADVPASDSETVPAPAAVRPDAA